MQILLTCALGLVACLSLTRRQVLAIGVVLRVIFPSVTGPFFFGDWSGSLALHPTTVLISIAAIVWLPSLAIAVRREFSERMGVYWTLLFLVSAFVLVTQLQRGIRPLLGLYNAFALPLLFFFLVSLCAQAQPDILQYLAKLSLGLAIAESLLALIQFAIGYDFPWAPYMRAEQLARPVGTLDSPLDLAFILACSLPLTARLVNAKFRFAAAGLIWAGIIVSQSRLPSALGTLTLLWLIASSIRRPREWGYLLATILVGVWSVSSLALLDGLKSRLSGDDGNSMSKRHEVYAYAWNHLMSFLWHGNGWGSAYILKREMFGISLESGYFIYAFDLGLLFTLLYLGVLLRVALSSHCLPVARGSRVSALAAIVLTGTYSGVTTMSAASLYLWLVLALIGVRGSRAIPDEGLGGRSSIGHTGARRLGAPRQS